jgi:hypothetical protein
MLEFLRQKRQDLSRNERGVSEVIGYAFVVAAVLSAVVLISLSSGPIIDHVQSEQSLISGQQSLSNIDGQIQKVEFGSDFTFYRTELPAGQYRTSEMTNIQVSNTNGKTVLLGTHPIQYTSDNGAYAVYEAGFVAVRPGQSEGAPLQVWDTPSETYMSSGGNYMFRAPEILHPERGLSIASTGSQATTFLISRTDKMNEPRAETFTPEGGTVTITATSDNPSAWELYLEKHDAFSVTSTSYSLGGRGTVEAEAALATGEQLTVVSEQIVVSEIG